jgi:hypothetical protein
MIELLVRVEASRLSPVLAADADMLVGNDGDYMCRLTTARPRSLDQLRLYWAVCAFIAEALDAEPAVNKAMIDHTLKVEAGHYDIIQFVDGRCRYQVRSIAFNKLSQSEFSAYMNRAFDISAKVFGPALTEAARAHMLEIMKGRPDARKD